MRWICKLWKIHENPLYLRETKKIHVFPHENMEFSPPPDPPCQGAKGSPEPRPWVWAQFTQPGPLGHVSFGAKHFFSMEIPWEMSLRESDIWSFVRFVVKKTSNHAAMDDHDIHDLVLRPWGILSVFCLSQNAGYSQQCKWLHQKNEAPNNGVEWDYQFWDSSKLTSLRSKFVSLTPTPKARTLPRTPKSSSPLVSKFCNCFRSSS
jgi:hypothetical protein